MWSGILAWMLQGLHTCLEVGHHPEQPLRPGLLKTLSFQEVPPLGLNYPGVCFAHSSEEVLSEEANLRCTTSSQRSVIRQPIVVQGLLLTHEDWASLLCGMFS